MHKQRGCCGDLLEKTAGALDKDTVALMLLAVQRGNLELSVKVALNRYACLLKIENYIINDLTNIVACILVLSLRSKMQRA
jgi:hypothetical protein